MHKEKEAENWLVETESKYHLVQKLHKCDNTIRHLNSKKCSLEMELKNAEPQLKGQKNIQIDLTPTLLKLHEISMLMYSCICCIFDTDTQHFACLQCKKQGTNTWN